MTKLLLFLVLVSGFCSQVSAREEIIWLTADKQSLINLGKDGFFSIATDTDNLLLKELPQYEVIVQHVPLERIARFLGGEESYCIPNWGKNKQRASHNLFSLPMKAYPGLKLYWLANNQRLASSKFNGLNQDVDFKKLFKKMPTTVIGVTAGRSYGEYLDRHIASFEQKNVFVRHGDYHFSLLVKMFSRNRFDFMIEFPNNMKKALDMFSDTKQLRSQSIKGIERYHLGHIACSKTAKNRRYLADVNTALKKIYLTDEFYQAHARYITDADLPSFRKKFNKIFELSN